MRETTNPKMHLMKQGAKPEAEQMEHEGAKAPQVGKIPTGMKAAKKFM